MRPLIGTTLKWANTWHQEEVYVLESSGRAPRGLDPFQDLIYLYIFVWLPEANPIFRNDLGPRGVIIPRVWAHGEPWRPSSGQNFQTKQKKEYVLRNVKSKLDLCSLGTCLEGGYPYTKKRIECLHL